MDKVTVYSFEVWDTQTGKYVAARRMATAETIRRVEGEADLESQIVVDRSEVDEYGYHAPKPTDAIR